MEARSERLPAGNSRMKLVASRHSRRMQKLYLGTRERVTQIM
jgi:hypothetical protein